MWESTWRQCGELRFGSNAESSVVDLESLLDELRLDGEQIEQHNLTRTGTVLRHSGGLAGGR